MSYLKNYVECNNNSPMVKKFSYPVTSQTQADRIFIELGNDLSGERLHEDGEASSQEVEDKYNYYVAVIEELLDLGYIIRGKALETDGLYGGEY